MASHAYQQTLGTCHPWMCITCHASEMISSWDGCVYIHILVKEIVGWKIMVVNTLNWFDKLDYMCTLTFLLNTFSSIYFCFDRCSWGQMQPLFLNANWILVVCSLGNFLSSPIIGSYSSIYISEHENRVVFLFCKFRCLHDSFAILVAYVAFMEHVVLFDSFWKQPLNLSCETS